VPDNGKPVGVGLGSCEAAIREVRQGEIEADGAWWRAAAVRSVATGARGFIKRFSEVGGGLRRQTRRLRVEHETSARACKEDDGREQCDRRAATSSVSHDSEGHRSRAISYHLLPCGCGEIMEHDDVARG
jgi:hypothetical protein